MGQMMMTLMQRAMKGRKKMNLRRRVSEKNYNLEEVGN